MKPADNGRRKLNNSSDRTLNIQLNKSAYGFENMMWSRYRISVIEYAVLRHVEQDNKCKICSVELNEESRPHVDHCHKYGDVRAILCHRCNVTLHSFEDHPVHLLNMYKYLDYHNILKRL